MPVIERTKSKIYLSHKFVDQLSLEFQAFLIMPKYHMMPISFFSMPSSITAT